MNPIEKNTLFYGDNLKILKEYILDESVDLIYLDPPFNSKRTYNVLFKDESGVDSEAQIKAFDDTWHWDMSAQKTYHELIVNSSPQIARMIGVLYDFIGNNQMMAYLVMMTARLIELHRILKSTGSIYLHCDPTASHYLKIVLDTIWGVENFRAEIVWKRTSAHSNAKNYGSTHDIVFYYAKTEECKWNQQYQPYSQDYIDSYYRYVDDDGRKFMSSDLVGHKGVNKEFEWKGIIRPWRYPKHRLDELESEGKIFWTKNNFPRYKRYLDEMSGMPIQDLWNDIVPVVSWSNERLGYPTQKPLALLERILEASSNEGEWVLDPFCGCGTAVIAAEKLNRHWIGIDITHLSIALQKYRLKDAFKLEPKKDYEVVGEPTTLGSARQLAMDDRYQFQWWALSLVSAKPLGDTGSKIGKKGKDKGVDGVINFIDDSSHKPKRIIIQVKSGKVKSGDIRDLKGTVEREKAAIGVFITLEEFTKDMKAEAFSAGFYESSGWHANYPKIQIFTIEELLNSAKIQMPPEFNTFKKSQRIENNHDNQVELIE